MVMGITPFVDPFVFAPWGNLIGTVPQVPEPYWNAVSNEQVVKWLCINMGNLAEWSNTLDETMSGKITDLDGRVTDAENTVDAMETRVTTNETNIADLQGRVTTNETNIADLQGRVTTNETNIADLQGRVTTNETNIKETQNDVNTITARIAALENNTSNGNNVAYTEISTHLDPSEVYKAPLNITPTKTDGTHYRYAHPMSAIPSECDINISLSLIHDETTGIFYVRMVNNTVVRGGVSVTVLWSVR